MHNFYAYYVYSFLRILDSLSHMHTCYFVSLLRKKIMSTLTLKRRKRTIVEKYEIIMNQLKERSSSKKKAYEKFEISL